MTNEWNDKPVLLYYEPAASTEETRKKFAATHEFTGEDAHAQAFLSAVGWLHSTRGFAIITTRFGRKVRLVHED
jgi:hypothetical protein